MPATKKAKTAPKSKLTVQEIYLHKRSKIMVASDGGHSTISTIATVGTNLKSLGFGLSQNLIKRLLKCSTEQVTALFEEILPILRKMVGSHKRYKPMYPNFPQQVMEASEAELYFNAIANYFGFALSDFLGDPSFVILPNYEKENRPEFDEMSKLKWIDLGSEEDFNNIYTTLLLVNSSISETDKEVLRWFFQNWDADKLSDKLPDQIPQKETLSFAVANAMPDKAACFIPLVKTATDVLRVAVGMSNGDVSLAEKTKFRNFSKPERRFLLECLERCGESMTEDMLRHPERFKRLSERLHPGDYAKRYPRALASFKVCHEDTPVATFASQTEALVKKGDGEATSEHLSKRPGEFARRLDHVLRTHTSPAGILSEFARVAGRVSTPVLLQAWCHFKHRNSQPFRPIFPKGILGKVQNVEGLLPEIPGDWGRVTADELRAALTNRFSDLENLGKVYIDPALKDQIVPFSQRSASKALRTVSRGSKFSLEEGKDTIRFFIWWKNAVNERVDIDLSASIYNEDWSFKSDIAYYNLKAEYGCHSGDITSAPNGACEFIDINMDAARKDGRFIVMTIHSYTGQPYCDLPECFGGWMMREKPKSGEIFDARTVQDKVDLTSDTGVVVPLIIDMKERKVCWADLSLTGARYARGNSKSLSRMGKAICGLVKPTLYDLFSMHAESRGRKKLVETMDEVGKTGTIFSLHPVDPAKCSFARNITAYDTDLILSQYLVNPE